MTVVGLGAVLLRELGPGSPHQVPCGWQHR